MKSPQRTAIWSTVPLHKDDEERIVVGGALRGRCSWRTRVFVLDFDCVVV